MMLHGDNKKQYMAVGQKTIYIKPGMGPETVMTFPKEGHQRQGQHQSDLIISFVQTPHNCFKRFQNDLILEHKISLQDALNAGPIHFKTMDNEQIEISIDEVINPDTFRLIYGKGMPILNDNPLSPIKQDFMRGNLILKFDI
jgi:DnaJ-class molecular chaperone